MIKIGIVEDNSFLAQSLMKKLKLFEGFSFQFHAVNGLDLLEQLAEGVEVDVILMDIQMPQMNGIEATRAVLQKHPQIKILMLTVVDDDQHIYEAIQAGAVGYLLKESTPQNIYESIKNAMAGGAALSPEVAMKAMKMIQNPNRVQKEKIDFALSTRELDVLQQLCKGLNYKQISNNLDISPNTVRRHTENIYKKLEVHNKVEAMQKAFEYKLV
jgi:DNA-binding NarL/FixJ family response regulator